MCAGVTPYPATVNNALASEIDAGLPDDYPTAYWIAREHYELREACLAASGRR